MSLFESIFSNDTSGGDGSSPLTTKGDLYGYSTTDARLPVGTDNQILSANSSESLGVKWIDNSSTPLKRFYIQFAIGKAVNIDNYYYIAKHTGDTDNDNIRSGRTVGMQYVGKPSPGLILFDSTLVKCYARLMYGGGNGATPAATVTWANDIMRQDKTTESGLGAIDFSFATATHPVGQYGNVQTSQYTNFVGDLDLDIDVNQGDLIALKFDKDTGTDRLNAIGHAYVCLEFEER